MVRTFPEKMGIKPGMTIYLSNAPEEFSNKIKAAGGVQKKRLVGYFELIHLFAISQADFHKNFLNFKRHLYPNGSLWVSWPKSKKLNTDLTLTKVIELGYDYGLVESKTISIDDTWSAIKFTHPKPGKKYNNSYGQLKM